MLSVKVKDKIIINQTNIGNSFNIGIISNNRKGDKVPYFVYDLNEREVVIERLTDDTLSFRVKEPISENGGHIVLSNGSDKVKIEYTFDSHVFTGDDVEIGIEEISANNGTFTGCVISRINGKDVPWEIIKTDGIIPFIVSPTKGSRKQEIRIKVVDTVCTSIVGYITIAIKGTENTRNVHFSYDVDTNELNIQKERI